MVNTMVTFYHGMGCFPSFFVAFVGEILRTERVGFRSGESSAGYLHYRCYLGLVSSLDVWLPLLLVRLFFSTCLFDKPLLRFETFSALLFWFELLCDIILNLVHHYPRALTGTCYFRGSILFRSHPSKDLPA